MSDFEAWPYRYVGGGYWRRLAPKGVPTETLHGEDAVRAAFEAGQASRLSQDSYTPCEKCREGYGHEVTYACFVYMRDRHRNEP